MAEIRRRSFDRLVVEAIAASKPILGICVGYQVLFEEGLEFGHHAGLGVFKGRVERFVVGPSVPHVGWNEVRWTRRSPLCEGLPEDTWFYFVHSYHPTAVEAGDVIAVSHHGGTFPAASGHDRVWGVQFHPEKSQRAGLQLLANFLAVPSQDPGP
jgi:glutamine amidotransferase